MIKSFFSLTGILFLIGAFSSCTSTRQLQYMQGQFDTAKLSQIKYPEPLIQNNDLVSINVFSDNPLASAFFNLPSQSGSLANHSTPSASLPATTVNSAGSVYLVDEGGNIQFPGLGLLHIAGLTKKELYQVLDDKLKDKLQNPYYVIRFESYKVTLIGEVAKPGQFTIPNERVSLLEAISLAGDLTVYGRRDNILVIREINGHRTFGRLDLRSPDILNSSYFYLQPNDVVYVDLNKAKASMNDQVAVRNITIGTSILSLTAVLISILRK